VRHAAESRVPVTSHRRAATPDLPQGTPLGKYEIVRKIATGGMAEIYLARVRGDAGFEKLVVLKRILPSIANDTTFVQMFLDEARLAATLHHPNIADVYDVGEDDGDLFFAMEYIHGQDLRLLRLRARERGELVSLPVALAVIHGAALALGYAHDKTGTDGNVLGLVHRDVSASNVMVSYDGAIKLLDFGIARARGNAHKTQTGILKGKVPYMSPEQCRGVPLDRRSDLFSLGVVLYEVTVGRRPFRGEGDYETMDQIVNHAPPRPSSVIEGYPRELEAIVMKMLARKPAQRYQTAGAMIADLEPFQAQHRQWVSSNALGKYMRTMFADQFQAWEHAQQDGVSLLQHVAKTIASQSQKAELVTPPSEFPAVFVPDEVARPEPQRQPAPPLRPSRRGLRFALVAILAVSVGAVAALTLGRSDHDTPMRAAPEATVKMKVSPPEESGSQTPGQARSSGGAAAGSSR
jgi:serine/threonine protein kinase